MTDQSNPSPNPPSRQSNNMLYIVIAVVAVLVLAALAFWLFSGGNASSQTPEPAATSTTAVSTATPTTDAGAAGTPAIATATPDSEASVDAPLIQEITWVWVDRTDPSAGASEAIENSAQYTLLFQPDGSYQFQADCNSGSGTYTADASGAIRMTAGPMTLAECGEGSLGQEFLSMMQAVQDYRMEEDGSKLILVWPAGGPEDGFRAQ